VETVAKPVFPNFELLVIQYKPTDPVDICNAVRAAKLSNIRIIFSPEINAVRLTELIKCDSQYSLFGAGYQWFVQPDAAAGLGYDEAVLSYFRWGFTLYSAAVLPFDTQARWEFCASMLSKEAYIPGFELPCTYTDLTAYDVYRRLIRGVYHLRNNSLTLNGSSLAAYFRTADTPTLSGRLQYTGTSVQPDLPVQAFSVDTPTFLLGSFDPITKLYHPWATQVFMGNMTTPPLAFPPPVIIDPAPQIAVVLTGFASVGLCLFALVTVWLIYYRRHPAIKASSTLFAFYINFGAALMLVSSLVRLHPQPYQNCFTGTLLFDIGVELILSSLCVKTFRIHRIFNGSLNASKKYFTNKALTMQALPFLVYTLILDFVWLGVRYSGPQLLVQSLANNEYYYRCKDPGLWLGLRAIVPAVLLILCLILAYNVRTIKKDLFRGSFC